MATIAWTDEARRWIEDIFGYIAADNPAAAARTIQDIYERAQVLATFPEMRALFQRKQGRDLFDLYWALTAQSLCSF